jgi:hypothetical protein
MSFLLDTLYILMVIYGISICYMELPYMLHGFHVVFHAGMTNIYHVTRNHGTMICNPCHIWDGMSSRCSLARKSPHFRVLGRKKHLLYMNEWNIYK